MARRSDPDDQIPLLASTPFAARRGLTHDQARQRVRSGEWERIRRGFYLTSDDWLSDDLDEFAVARLRHVHRAIAAAHAHPRAVVAYESAAAVLSCPTWSPLDIPVNLVVATGQWTGQRAGIRIRRLDLPSEHVERTTIPVTTPARTWLDIARRGSLATSLVVGDVLLARSLTTQAELVTMAEFAEDSALPGRTRVRRALPHLDPLRESPLESASAAYFITHRIRRPRVQVEIFDRAGAFLARVDFLWDDLPSGVRVVGEADGRVKYLDAATLYEEKRREDALRALGYTVVRWGAADLRNADLARRLRQLLH